MNREYVLWNLREASEELRMLIAGLETGEGVEEFHVGVTHLYHHLNTAWNARDASDSEARECSGADFLKWRQFPTDIDLSHDGAP